MTVMFFGLHATEVTHSTSAINFRVGVHDFFPGAGLWKAQSEVVIRVTGKVDDDSNRISGGIKTKEAEDVLVGVATINPLEAIVFVV